MTKEFYKYEDFFPTDYENVIYSKLYRGCFIAATIDKKSLASV